MNYKHSCVIDSHRFYVTYVLVHLLPDRNGDTQPVIQFYTLKDGERLLDTLPPTGFLKARWNGQEWEESAS